MVTSNRTPAQEWEARQRVLDAESRELAAEYDRQTLEDRLGQLSPERWRIHEELKHDPKRCRCLEIEGV